MAAGRRAGRLYRLLVACHALGPVTNTVPGQDRGGAGDDMRKIEQHTVHVRVHRQDGSEHSAVGAPTSMSIPVPSSGRAAIAAPLNPPVRLAIAAVNLGDRGR